MVKVVKLMRVALIGRSSGLTNGEVIMRMIKALFNEGFNGMAVAKAV